MNWVFFSLSWLCVAFGQGTWHEGWGIIASTFGFALFWKAMLGFPSKKGKFFLSWVWFFLVQCVQLSWLTSNDYMGQAIFGVYLLLALGIGFQFALISLFFPSEKRFLSLLQILTIASAWVLLEWSRLGLLTGFPWNPVGLCLVSQPYAIQLASIGGIYALSFWAFFVNLLLWWKVPIRKRLSIWAIAAIFPYAFGFLQQTLLEKTKQEGKSLSVALVQTSLFPEQKDRLAKDPKAFIPPLNQWERIIQALKRNPKADLIVLPEGALPWGRSTPLYPIEQVKAFWIEQWGSSSQKDFPLLSPLEKKKNKVGNGWIAQALANHYNAHLIIGLDDEEKGKAYNAAFHFHPRKETPDRYEKQILIPIGEYVPFTTLPALSEWIATEFGILASFDSGKEGKLFHLSFPVGISICLEEVYSHLMRDLRLQGAELFINLTNDVWFPSSKLPWHHWQHGKVRSVENGVFSLRACNTGVTGAIDCFGRTVALLPPSEEGIEVLHFKTPVYSFQTPYSFFGDGLILSVSIGFLCLYLLASLTSLRNGEKAH